MYQQSFYHAVADAFDGMRRFMLTERNAKIQLAVAMVTIITAATLRISTSEWIALLLCIGSVMAFELMNTAVEELCNTLHPERSASIKRVKHVSAGAVLCTALMAIAVGCIIIIPKLLVYVL